MTDQITYSAILFSYHC